MPSDDRSQEPLRDIVRSIATIDEFTNGFDYDRFTGDLKTKLAVERLLQIITEAAYRLGDEAGTICPGPDWKGLRGMGNILRHAYHQVDDAVVWSVVKEDLPVLQEAASRALGRLLGTSGPDDL